MEALGERGIEELKDIHRVQIAALEAWEQANSEEAKEASYDAYLKATERHANLLSIHGVNGSRFPADAPWPPFVIGANRYRLRKLLDALDPFIGDNGARRERLPDGRRLRDLAPEEDALKRLAASFKGRGEPIPGDLAGRPFMRWLDRQGDGGAPRAAA